MRHIHSSPKISDRCVLIPAMAPSPTASATDPAARAAFPQASTPGTEVRKILSTAMNRPIPEWCETRLLQAAVLPHQFDLATERGGMPLWRIGVLADLSTATETVALALFSYSSRSEAEAAAQHVAKTWDGPMPATSMEVFRTQSGHSLDPEAF